MGIGGGAATYQNGRDINTKGTELETGHRIHLFALRDLVCWRTSSGEWRVGGRGSRDGRTKGPVRKCEILGSHGGSGGLHVREIYVTQLDGMADSSHPQATNILTTSTTTMTTRSRQ